MKRMVLAVLLFLFFIFGNINVYAIQKKSTIEQYGENIIYYNFTEIPNNLALTRKIEMPFDLEEYVENKWSIPRIKNILRFEKEFWDEAIKLGYSKEKFQNMNIQEAVWAAVKITCSRISYFDVDADKAFIKKYGVLLPADEYFHLKLGDCDKYANITIACFNIIKRFNKNLQNVYLSQSDLGGNNIPHAWICILIVQKDGLIISHIDPTFYDNKDKLEASDYHLDRDNNFYLVNFYSTLKGVQNQRYAYQLAKSIFLKTKNDKKDIVLSKMSYICYIMSMYKSIEVFSEIEWILKEWNQEDPCREYEDLIFYNAYMIYKSNGNTEKAFYYKDELLKKYPNSFWARHVRDQDKK